MRFAYFQFCARFLMTAEGWNIYNRLGTFVFQPCKPELCLGVLP